MGLTTLTLPRLGETMEEARVTDWLVAPGASFGRGDVLLEVETDKTVVEVPALSAGIMRAHLVASGDLVEIGQAIAEVETQGAAPALPEAGDVQPSAEKAGAYDVGADTPALASPAGPGPRASPLARRQAQRRSIDLNHVTGTGRGGRVTGTDVALAASAGSEAGALICDRQGMGGHVGTVLLLHGLFASAAGFAGFPARLSLRGVQVLTPDLHGEGNAPELARLEDALESLVRTHAPQGDLFLIGHSMGAILATRLARRLGNRLKSLVLLAPAGLGPRINQDFLDILCNAETPAALRRGLALLGTGPISDALLIQELTRLRQHRPSHRALAGQLASGGVQQVDILPDLAMARARVSAMFGTADAVLDWKDCARLPARTAIHLRDGVGHLPHMGADDLVEELILGQVDG